MRSSGAKRVLVLGYGNTLRGDDGFGWRAAEAFARRAGDVDVRLLHQLAPELAEDVAGYEIAIFIDAAADGEPGTVCCREVRRDAPEAELSHHLTPEALLALSRRLYGRAPSGVAITVSGESFDLGEVLSRRVQAELPRVLRLVGEMAANPARARSVILRRHAPPRNSAADAHRRHNRERVCRDPQL